MACHDFFPYIIDRAPLGIIIVSQEKIEFLNPACEKISGYTKDELQKGRLGFIDYVHPEDKKLVLERLRARKENRSIPSNFLVRIVGKDGKIIFLEFETTPVPGHQGSSIGIIKDVTQRKLDEDRLKESETKFKGLVERAREGIVVIQDGLIIYANPFMKEISGFTPEEYIGKPFHNFVATEFVDIMVDRHKRRISGEPVISTYEAVLKNKYLKSVHVEIHVNEFISEGKKNYLTVIRDITKHNDTVFNLRATLNKLRYAMNGTIQAISMVLESRDPYTAGHQRRVSDLARAIATELGLSEEQIDTIRIAGTLHDIGKIAVPAEILTKSATLTSIERELIRVHPRVAYDILKKIDFPWAIADIVYQHHERLDGSGYPQGLKGDQMLLASKILAVADVTEAMISHRPYRAALGLEAALAELSLNKGNFYDTKAVEACIKLFMEKGFDFHKWADGGHPT